MIGGRKKGVEKREGRQKEETKEGLMRKNKNTGNRQEKQKSHVNDKKKKKVDYTNRGKQGKEEKKRKKTREEALENAFKSYRLGLSRLQ